MSISFNHPKNKVTSTSTLELIVLDGTPAFPSPIRLTASSMIIPVVDLPAGEMGALVLDRESQSMKYHNGTSWIELLSADDILAPINISLDEIYRRLDTKVDNVIYTTSAVPSATISGTTLNIIFPYSGGGGTGPTGLYTSLKPGCITQYSLTSGQNATQIREQMSGIAGGQDGRDGSQSNPWKTSDGWCLADGMWWQWEGDDNLVLKQVPNLSRSAYLQGMDINGATRTDTVLASSATISGTALSIAQLPPHQFSVSGQTAAAGNHNHYLGTQVTTTAGIGRSINPNPGGEYGQVYSSTAGNHIHTFTGVTNVLGSGQTHTHGISNIDVNHFITAYLYNIAESSVALSEKVANSRYVLKTGDTMTGPLVIGNQATIKGADATLGLFFRNANNGERAAIYHDSSSNKLSLRSAGGAPVLINSGGEVEMPSTLNVKGAVVMQNTLNVSGATRTGVLNVTGQITATGDIWAFSDERLKENIKPIENALDKVDSITGVTGNFIGEETVRSMVLAQQVQAVLPEAVSTDENGYLKVSYDALIPLLLNAVSSLRAEVNELRGKK